MSIIVKGFGSNVVTKGFGSFAGTAIREVLRLFSKITKVMNLESKCHD